MSIDQAALTRRRDRVVETLSANGDNVLRPQGTFYVWSDWLEGDPGRSGTRWPTAACSWLPGRLMRAPGCFRISLTASDEMGGRALPEFEASARP